MSRTAKQVGTPAAPPVRKLDPVSATFLFSFLLALAVLATQASDVGMKAVALIAQHTRLDEARGITQEAWIAMLIACGNDPQCGPWQSAYFRQGMAWFWLVLLLPVIAPIVAYKVFPKPKPVTTKDPGLAQWETKDRLKRMLAGNDSKEDPFVGFLGYLKGGKGANDFDTTNLPALYVPLEDWNQNTLVWGGIRSGKTTSFFQPNLFLGAHLGVTSVVFDVKWPQKNSGFYESIGYWHARGRPVVLFCPYEPTGARINLLAGVNSFSDALGVGDAVFPPPEFMEERGKHYNEKKRFMIAALSWLLKSEKGEEANLRDVLDLAMLPDDRLEEWMENARDEQAKQIIQGYREAGDANFAETKNGLITALKVFFDDRVVHATSGLPHETVDLRDIVRTPHLAVVGINQKHQMDGGAEVLFRLYKRMFDIAAMEVAEEQGGRLRTHLSYWMDELPAIGKINYMMRSLGTLRSYNIAHHIGIQNDAQGRLVYGDIYWQAISTNVVARVIVFPRGINGDDAVKVSEMIGKTTALEVSVGGSRDMMGLDGMNNSTGQLVERYLLGFEEFSEFSLGEAVVRINGQHPIRTQLVPSNLSTIEGTGIQKNKHPHLLHTLFKDTVDRCPGGLIAYTTRLIQEGRLIGVPGALAQQAAPRDRAVPAAPTRAMNSTGGEATGPTVQTVNLPPEQILAWLRAAMTAHAEINLVEEAYSVRLTADLPEAVGGDTVVGRFVVGGLLERNKARTEVRLSARAMRSVDEALHAELTDHPDCMPVYRWLGRNGLSVIGMPERQAATEAELELGEARASIEDGVLLTPKMVTREMFGSQSLRFEQRRVGSRNLDLIPVSDRAATAAAVRAARIAAQAPEGEAPKGGTGLSRRERKRSAAELIEHAFASPEVTPPPGKVDA